MSGVRVPSLSRLAPDEQGRLMPGVVSFGEYVIYWIGLAVITVGASALALKRRLRVAA